MTAVERNTRCVIGWRVLWQRDQEVFQDMIDTSPKAQQYFSDAFPVYSSLVYYPGKFRISDGKTDTFSVEGVNAEFRHYLARLVRRSRCFSDVLMPSLVLSSYLSIAITVANSINRSILNILLILLTSCPCSSPLWVFIFY